MEIFVFLVRCQILETWLGSSLRARILWCMMWAAVGQLISIISNVNFYSIARTYQHIETLGLYLFNDSLVVTRRTSKHFSFERQVDYNYRFEACAALHRLRVEDIPDSKCKFKQKSEKWIARIRTFWFSNGGHYAPAFQSWDIRRKGCTK